MQYLNEHYKEAILKNPKYLQAIEKMKKEVREFYDTFYDDPKVISVWGHNYFCDYDGGRLIFDIHKPHEHKCSVCGKVFSNEIYDGVWVYFYRNQAILSAWKAAGIYAFTHETLYLTIAKHLLSFYADHYKEFVLHNKEGKIYSSYEEMKWGCGRILPQGLNESIICIRMIQALEIIKNDVSPEFLNELYEKMFSEMVLLFKPQIDQIHNIRCWNNCALGLIGLFFHKEEVIHFVFHGPYNIRRQIDEGVTEDGFWYEGSIHYNFFTLEGITPLLLFSEIYHYDFGAKEKEIVHKMFIHAYHYAFDNQVLPNPNDGWPNINLKTYSYIYHMASRVFGEYSDVGNLLKNIENHPLPRTTLPLSKPYYIDNEIAYERLLLNTDYDFDVYEKVIPVAKNFPKSNFATLRNDNINVFVKYGLNGPSHSHPDLINMEIMYKNRMISRDLSNCGYRAKLCDEWHRTSLAHNVVIRNGENIPSVSPGKTLEFQPTKICAKAENVYPQVDAIRTIEIDSCHIMDCYEIHAAEEATFDYVFHLESDFEISSLPLEKATLGYEKNGYQHVLETYRVKDCPSKLTFFARAKDLVLTLEFETQNKEVFILKTMDNPVNKTRTTILLREKGTTILYQMKLTIKEEKE